ncbi:amidase [Streptomyces sp. NPDC050625]|uniref:amidase n=1 Tax=Streptomyces sp. NPDC050625 TaxID=3154629 RepID=UPI003425BB75
MDQPRTITEAAAALESGRTTSEELVESAIHAADQLDEILGVFINRYAEQARAQAREIDARRSAGEALGPLAGIPLGIKDIVAESQGPTTAQSLVLDPEWGQRIGDAPIVTRLKQAGGIVMGKTSTLEFAIGNPDRSKPFPVPASAWNADRWAGGSSSGSASGVASDMFLGAIGTDTAGSISMPSAFNGITGLKPTFGRVPKSGIVSLGYTADHPGPMARSAADCALMLSVIAGYDASDTYCADRPVDDYLGALTGDLAGVRIGFDTLEAAATGGIDPAQPDLFQSALRELEAAGAEVVPVTVPMWAEGITTDLVIMLSEALAYHQSDLQSRWSDYGQGFRIAVGAGDAFSGADYVQAQRVRRVIRNKLSALYQEVDLIVTPTAHVGPPLLSDVSTLNPIGVLASVQTPYWPAVGVPVLTVPIGTSSVGTPLAMSIAGPWWHEAHVLCAGDAYQRRTSFHLERSPLIPPAGA